MVTKTSKTKNDFNSKKIYLFSFLVPVLIMFIIFIVRKIYPFGEESFLHIDMYHQYFPFLSEFYHKLKSGESLFYSWNTGIGSNFIALYVYYLASPFNWLCILFPENLLMEFQSYMAVLKIGACGFTFAYYIRHHFKTESLSIILFAVFYALSGYMAAYNWNVMWLDCIAIAPIVILGLEKLVTEGKYKLYCLSLAFAIFSNYYLSIMLCIYLVLYFIVLLIEKSPSDKINSDTIKFPKLNTINNFYIKAFIRFFIFSLLAGGIAALLLIPELAAIRFSEFSDIDFPNKIKTYFSVFDMIARHSFNVIVETGLDHWPNIYCGVAIFIFLPLYVLQKKIPVRQKAPKLILLGFILISFSTNMLNFIWHGLNYPDSLPARQSFLYIFLLITLCFEAFIYIKEFSNKDLKSVLLGVLIFVLLAEKLITDDSFGSTCFLVTGLFLLLYSILIYFYREKNKASVWILLLTFIIVSAEAGLNTFYTSVPTVSRTTYLSNYDAYQLLTERTVNKENNDFFRFEKFARRTQNDAMLIGFQGGSYFSSTINSLVCDFYEKYGMRASRVNYCFEGATPVTSAFLANRYMLYTLDRGYDNVFELSDTEGNLYLYKNNYSVPLGYMLTPNSYSEFDKLFTKAKDKLQNIHAEDNDMDSCDNPIECQNLLVRRTGIPKDMFIPVEISANSSETNIYIDTDAHYYAYSPNTKIDDIKLNSESGSKTFSSIKKKYILDIGYHTDGSTISLNSKNGQNLNLRMYRLDENVLKEFIDRLNTQTMTVNSYDETHINGTINVNTAGQLILSVPYEPGWTLKIDGIKTEMDIFEDAFISVYLEEGSHQIELTYIPEGFIPGVIISIISILLFVAICFISKKFK